MKKVPEGLLGGVSKSEAFSLAMAKMAETNYLASLKQQPKEEEVIKENRVAIKNTLTQ